MELKDMTYDECVETYVKARDLKADAKKLYSERAEKADRVMGKLENELLRRFNDQGVDNVKTPSGTAYRNSKTSATVGDASAFRGFVCESLAKGLLALFPNVPVEQHEGFVAALALNMAANEGLDYFNNAANKEAVATMRDATGDIPPGVKWSEMTAIGIRRS